VVSTGAISGEVRRAVESLGLDLKGELDFGFLHVNQIKPLGETTRKILEASNDILVLEEHLAYGGLSSAIRDARSDQVGKMSTRIKSINLGEEFPQQQSHQRGLELAGLSSFAIQAVLKEFVKSDE
jgi:transketolase C-terminal domain/subunit